MKTINDVLKPRSPANESTRKNYEIEALRGISMLLVLVAHAGFLLPFYAESFFMPLFSRYSFTVGVDLFFCISGFVVASAYMDFFDQHRDRRQYTLALKVFWLRRAYRLFPTAWLWVLVGIAACIGFNQSGQFSDLRSNLVSLLTVLSFTGNVTNLFHFGNLLGPNGVYWTLALEEQFYFVFPFFLLLFRGARRWQLAVLIIAISILLNRNVFGSLLQQILYVTRIDGFLWGILIYMFSRTAVYEQCRALACGMPRWSGAILCGLLLLVLGIVPAVYFGVTWAYALVALISAALILLASFRSGMLTRMSLLSVVLLWCGKHSYAMYVIHMFAYRATHEIWFRINTANGTVTGTEHTLALLVTASILVVTLSALNYRFIEDRWRHTGIRLSRQLLSRDTRKDVGEIRAFGQ